MKIGSAIESGIREYPPPKRVDFFHSKWIVGYKKKVLHLHVGDIIFVQWGLYMYGRYYKKLKIAYLQSNNYAGVTVCDIDISVQWAVSYDEILEVNHPHLKAGGMCNLID